MQSVKFENDVDGLELAKSIFRVPAEKEKLWLDMLIISYMCAPQFIIRAAQIIDECRRVYPRKTCLSNLRLRMAEKDDVEIFNFLVKQGILEEQAVVRGKGHGVTLTAKFAETIPPCSNPHMSWFWKRRRECLITGRVLTKRLRQCQQIRAKNTQNIEVGHDQQTQV